MWYVVNTRVRDGKVWSVSQGFANKNAAILKAVQTSTVHPADHVKMAAALETEDGYVFEGVRFTVIREERL